MKKFLIKSVLVLLPTLLFVATINYFGDAANLFSAGYEQKIAQGLKSGYNVTNVSNYDERLLQKEMIDTKTCPQVVVIGSSRTMLINSDYFKNKTFLNNSVSGASLQDLLAIYELYEKNGCAPEHIILGLDPWTLNDNNSQSRWMTLEPEYNIIADRLNNKKESVHSSNPQSKYIQLVSPSYFQASIRNLNKNNELLLTKNKINSTFTRLVDGSICYDEKYRNSSPAKIDALVSDYMNGELYSIEKFNEISPKLSQLLEKFIVVLHEKKIKVSVLLLPYHPKVYKFISTNNKYKQVLRTEDFYHSLALKYNIEITGSFNPSVLKLDETAFYDGMHSKQKGVEKLMKILKK